VKIPMHVGYYKGLLRYMVGITVPDDRDGVWLTVNGATRHWAEGFDFLWDDTYPSRSVQHHKPDTHHFIYGRGADSVTLAGTRVE